MTEENHMLPDTINPNNFPAKLWRMVNNPANNAICWDNSGEIVLIDQQLFEKLVLSPTSNMDMVNVDTFKTTHFSSFVRQLNLYGFRKSESSCTTHFDTDNYWFPEEKNTVHHFFNPNFKRSHPELLVNLKRLTVDNKAKLDRGIDVRCRPPSKYQRVSFGEDSLEKCLMKGTPSSHVNAHKNAPILYSKYSNRNMPLTPHKGTPVPPRHLPWGHSIPPTSVLPQDTSVPVSLGPPYSTVLSSAYQQNGRSGVNYGALNFTGIHPRNEQYHPGFYSAVCQCYRPPLMGIANGMPAGPFSSVGYYPARYPVIDQNPVLQSNTKQEMKNDINLDTIFQIADEVMQTQPTNNNLTKIVTPEKQFSSSTLAIPTTGDNYGNTAKNNTGLQPVTPSGDALTTSDLEAEEVSVPVPEEAISEDTKDDINKIEVIQVEVNHTNDRFIKREPNSI